MKRVATGACLLIGFYAASAAVAQGPSPVTTATLPSIHVLDPRIRVIPYDPDRVVRVDAAFGFQMMIQFGPEERVQNVSIGDGSAWQVTPNKAATLLFIKPVDIATRTNMTVVTDRRSYLFELNAHQGGAGTTFTDPAYVMRFTYPDERKTGAVASPPPRAA